MVLPPPTPSPSPASKKGAQRGAVARESSEGLGLRALWEFREQEPGWGWGGSKLSLPPGLVREG